MIHNAKDMSEEDSHQVAPCVHASSETTVVSGQEDRVRPVGGDGGDGSRQTHRITTERKGNGDDQQEVANQQSRKIGREERVRQAGGRQGARQTQSNKSEGEERERGR